MANYNKDYNLEERLKRKRTNEGKNSSNTANSSGNNSKGSVKSNAFKDDIYNLQERLYGHKDRSVAVANGSERRVNQLNNAYQPLYDNMYRAGASVDGTFDDSIDKLFQKTGQALQYYKMYPDEFGDRLEPARELDTGTYNTLLDLKKGPIAARYGKATSLNGIDPKSDEYKQYKALLNLAGYDVATPGLMKQNNAKSFEEMAEIAKNFDLQNAMLTVEDYYRMVNSPVMGDGLSAARVDKADYDKAADDILTFTGIDVRDLAPDKVQSVLEQVGGMKDTIDYMQSYYRTQDRWNQEQQKQAEYDDFVSQSYAEVSADPEFAALSQYDEAETAPLYKAVMAPAGSDEQKKAVTELGYDWNARLNGIMPVFGWNSQDSYGFEFMSPEQRDEFAYRWKKNGSGDALQYLTDISWGVNKQRMEEEVAQSQEFADDGFLKGALASAESVGRGFVGELEGVYNAVRGAVGFDINEYDPGFLNTVKGQTERQTVGGNISEKTQNLNLFGKNIPQMAYNGLMSAADSLLNATAVGAAASPLMGAGAFNSAFQQNLADGKSDQDAFIDALVEGGIEMGTEYFSIDALMKDSTSPLGYFLRNLITEPTEEMTGFAAGEIYDNLKNGADSRVNQRIDELKTMGYSPEEAKKQAAREMLADLFETGFTAFLSGGTAAVGGTIQTAAANQTSGKNLQSHGDEAVKSMLDLANTFHFDEDVQSLIDEQSAILNDPNGKGGVLSPAKIGRIFRETMKAVDENAQQTIQNVTARYVAGELQKNGVDDPKMTDAVVRIVSDNGSAKPEDYQRVTASRGAIAVVEGLTGSIDNARNLSQKAARIAEQAAKKNKNKTTATTEETTEVAPEIVDESDELPEDIPTDAQLTAEESKKVVQDSAAEYMENADLVASAIYEEGQDPVTFSQQFRQAYEYGEEGRNLDVIRKSTTFSGMKAKQIESAYMMGRDARINRAKQAAQNRKGLVKVGNIDTSAIRNVKLNNSQRSSVRAISKLAQAVGFNVRFIDSATNAQGEFTEENGKWQKNTRTITIDVNAGRLSKDSTNYAMMQTAGHELTHFIKEFADTELFAQYQDFVFSHLSEKLTEADLDDKITGMIADYKAKNVELDRDGAIEEIVAEASGDALLKMTQEDFNELSQSNPTLMQKIGEFFKRWVGDIKALIKKAYSGQTAHNEIAEQMVDAVDELGKRWNELLKNAAASARETAVQQTESAPKAEKNQPVEAGRFLTYNHIDQRTPDTIRGVDSQLFSGEVEEAQVGFAAAAQMLLADVDASISGQKFFTDDGVTGQKRMTSDFLASMKDSTGWTWDKIKASLQQFAEMTDGETMPKNTVTNREMELYLDKVLSGGYTTIDGQKVAPWDEYIEAKEQYQGSRSEKAPQSAYDGAIDFVEYAFADDSGVKFQTRPSSGKYDFTKPFEQQVDDWVAGRFPEKETLIIGATPKIMRDVGFPNIPLTFDQKHMREILGKPKNADHDLGIAFLKKLPEHLKNPVAIIENAQYPDTGVRIVFSAKNPKANNNQIIAIANVDGGGQINGISIDATRIKTTHSNAQALIQLQNAVKKEDAANGIGVYYWNKKEALDLLGPGQVTSLGRSLKNGFIHSIQDSGSPVKMRIIKQTDTSQFTRWFKGSKIVNPDKTPKIMYHGSPNNFTVFDIKKAKSSGLYGKGFYFTDSASHGGTYGKLYEVYLSIKNPLTPGGSEVTRTQVRKFLEAVAENEDDFSIENYGTYDVNEILSSVYRKDAFAVIQDVNATAIGDMVEAVKLFNQVNGTKFDGIVVDTETVAFEATQIKSATDNIGTFDPENPDIRYQLSDPSQITDREILANVMESAAKNEAELDFVRRYRKRISSLNEKQAALEETNTAIVNARKAGKKADAAALQNKADILAKQIAREDGALLKFEAGKPLQAVVQREREMLKRKADERTKARVAKRVETVKRQEAEKREKLNQRLAEVREKRDQKLAALRQEKQDAVKKVREEKDESFGKAKYRKRIEEDVGKLRTWVTTPTNKEHIPQFLRGPIADMINALDFSSARSLKGGEATQKDAKLTAALDAMNAALSKLREQQTGLDNGASAFATIIDLPYGYLEDFTAMVAEIKNTLNATQAAGDIPINRMTAKQLQALSQSIRTLTTSIRQMNRLLANAKYESAVSAAGSTIDELGKMAAKKDTFKAVAGISKFMDWTNTVPYYAFKRFGKGGQAIFDGLMNGWDKLAFNSDELVKFANAAYTTKEVRQWSKEVQRVELSNGETVRMTTAQLMSLYCLSKRAQAVGHLLGGGIRIADIESKGKNIVQSENYTLTERDLDAFSEMLTDRQRQVADKLQSFMSTKGAEWGNEVSMKRFGYEMFTERFYFPIETDANNRIAIDEQAQENSLFRLLNMSATKGLVKGANNALVVRDIFDVFTAHSSDMAKYNALGLQILDALKWLNYVEKTQNDDGTLATRSVQKSLERAYGTDARKYILNLLRDLNGVREGGRNDGMVNKVISNAKIASVAGNVRVWLLQATSMPRAAYAINPKYLAVGFAKMHAHPLKGMRLVEDKVGIAKWKSMGFYDTNISGNIREMVKHDQSIPAKIREKSMAPAGFMDGMTMGVIYYAAESEVAEKYRNTPKGSDAWNKLVNDRVREIVYQTQVVDSTMTRSDAMRGKGIITLATSFMSEPTLTMNMLADSVYEARMNRRAGESIKAPTVKMVKALSVFTFAAVLTAAVEALFDAERDDDEYETFGEKYMSSFIGDLTEEDTAWEKVTKVLFSNVGSNLNILNNIPFASDAMGMLQGYDNSPMYSAFIDSFKSGYDAYQRWMEGKGTWYSWVYSGLKGVSQFTGLPISNVAREGISVWNTFVADWAKKPRIQTYSNNKSDAAEAYYEAVTGGDSERAAYILERAQINGISEEDIGGNISSYVKADYISGDITEAVARKRLSEYAGKSAEQIDTNIKEWTYERETGFKYDKMRQDYIDGNISKAQMQTLLAQYRGMDSEEVYWKLSSWDYAKTHDGDDGGKYSWFIDAVDSGSGYQRYADELLAHGVEKGDIASQITKTFKPRYIEVYGTAEGDRLREYLLDVYEYIGYDRDYEWKRYMSKWIDD